MPRVTHKIGKHWDGKKFLDPNSHRSQQSPLSLAVCTVESLVGIMSFEIGGIVISALQTRTVRFRKVT